MPAVGHERGMAWTRSRKAKEQFEMCGCDSVSFLDFFEEHPKYTLNSNGGEHERPLGPQYVSTLFKKY